MGWHTWEGQLGGLLPHALRPYSCKPALCRISEPACGIDTVRILRRDGAALNALGGPDRVRLLNILMQLRKV